MRRIAALLLLLVLGFSLSAGAHPCGAAKAASGPETHAAAHEAAPPCHGMGAARAESAAPASSSTQVEPGEDTGCCDPQKAEHPCVHACHLVAVSSASPMAFSTAPVSALHVGSPMIALRSPARSIDHIPLS